MHHKRLRTDTAVHSIQLEWYAEAFCRIFLGIMKDKHDMVELYDLCFLVRLPVCWQLNHAHVRCSPPLPENTTTCTVSARALQQQL